MMYLQAKPQWAPASIAEVEKILTNSVNRNYVVFEWGSGCSTPWLAQRAKYVFSMDDDGNWSKRAAAMCAELNVHNVDFSTYKAGDIKYLEAIFWFAEMGGIDLAVVDGVDRMRCFEYAVKYVRTGGLILLDDSETYKQRKQLKMDGIEFVWEVGTDQKTTLFRKK